MTTSHAIRKGFAKNISGIFLKKTAHGRVVEGRGVCAKTLLHERHIMSRKHRDNSEAEVLVKEEDSGLKDCKKCSLWKSVGWIYPTLRKDRIEGPSFGREGCMFSKRDHR